MRQRWQSGDSLELDDGADLQDSLGSGTNMVIQVGQVWTNNIQIAKFCQTQGVVQKTMTGKVPPPPQFATQKITPNIFGREMHLKWAKQILRLVPCKNLFI